MRSFQITPVIGLPKFDGWAQMINPSEQAQLVVAISGHDAQMIGRELLEWFDEQSFTHPQEIHEHLESAREKCEQAGVKLQFAVHAQLDDGHLFAAYNGSVVLKRGEKVGVLLPVSESMNLVMGNLNPGDTFVLSTAQAAPLLGAVQQQLEQGFDSDSIITSTVPTMHGQEDSSLSAMVFGDVLNPPAFSSAEFDEIPEFPEVPTESFYPDNQLDSVPGEVAETVMPGLLAEKKPLIIATPKISLKGVSSVMSKTGPFLRRMGKGLVGAAAVVSAGVKRQQGGVYVEPKDFRKWARIAVPVVVVVVGLLLFAGISFARRSQQLNEANEALTPLSAMLQSAREDVNTNPIAARQEVSQVIGQLEQMETAWKDKPTGQKQVIALLNEARQLYQDISGREEFKELNQFYDLRLTAPGEGTFLAQASFNEGDQAVFVDKDRKESILLELGTKQFQRQKVADDVNVKDVTLEGNTVWMLGGGLRSISQASGSATKTVRPEEDANRAAAFIQSYGPNVYVLNPDQQTIYRYAPSDSGYGEPTNWIRSSQGISFDQVTSMAIDGDVWLGTRDGQIKKLTTGRPVEFTVTGLSEGFSSSLIVVTDEDTDNLYVLEPNKSRVVVLNKTGEYLREFKSASLAAASDILVDEDSKLLLAVSGSLLLSLPL